MQVNHTLDPNYNPIPDPNTGQIVFFSSTFWHGGAL